MKTIFNDGDLIKEKIPTATKGTCFEFSRKFVDKDGFIEVEGWGKVHIENFEKCTDE